MNKIEEALWQDYSKVNEIIKNMSVGEEGYKEALEERDKIRNELIKFEQIDQDTKTKVSQIESENKRENRRNMITIGTFAVTTLVSVCTIFKTFDFDKVATVTSTLGRGTLNGVVPKLFRR